MTDSKIANAVELCERLGLWRMYHNTAMVEGIESLHKRMKQTLQETIAQKKNVDPARCEILETALSEWDHPEMVEYLMEKFA